MNMKVAIRAIAICGLYVVVNVVGLLIAYQILAEYRVVVDAVLGLAILILVYRLFKSPMSQDRLNVMKLVDDLVMSPATIKLFIRGFFGVMVLYWAGMAIVRLIFYLVQLYLSTTGL